MTRMVDECTLPSKPSWHARQHPMASEDPETLRADGDLAVPKHADWEIVALHTNVDCVGYGKPVLANVPVRQSDNLVHPVTTELFSIMTISVRTPLSTARRPFAE